MKKVIFINNKQKKLISDFKNEVLAKYPELAKCIYVEEYERNTYMILVSKPDRAYGKSIRIQCDFIDNSIIVGHDFRDEVCLYYDKITWISKLRQALDLFGELYLDINSQGCDMWEFVDIKSFWQTRYNAELCILEIQFPGALYYHYYDFTRNAVDELMKVDSPLIYFNTNIRNAYKYEKIFGGYADEKLRKTLDI